MMVQQTGSPKFTFRLILVAIVALCRPVTSSVVISGASPAPSLLISNHKKNNWLLLPQQKGDDLLMFWSLRGGGAHKATVAAHGSQNDHHLMSPFTAVANILADLCPHGMMPLGK